MLPPEGGGTIQPMRGGGALTKPLGLTPEQFKAHKGLIDPLSVMATGEAESDTLYGRLKDDETYLKFKAEILMKVAEAGILSSIEISPDNIIDGNHFKETSSIQMLFDNLKQRNITMDQIDIRLNPDTDELIITLFTGTRSDKTPPPSIPAASKDPIVAAAPDPTGANKFKKIQETWTAVSNKKISADIIQYVFNKDKKTVMVDHNTKTNMYTFIFK
jgi:hypothetical protein